MRKEAARRQEQEAKRLKRFSRSHEDPQAPSSQETPPQEDVNPPVV